MPSSGYPSAGILDICWSEADGTEEKQKEAQDLEWKSARFVIESAEQAMKHGLFIEWLDWFVGTWNQTKDPVIAATAGLDEWDL